MSNRPGLRKRTQQSKITIQKPPKKDGEFYFCSFDVDNIYRFQAVTDLTDHDIITKTKRKIKEPKIIKLKIEKTWRSIH